ncbi:hypothetical protein [Mesorhizobium sp. 8]|uniref:hypothetical protein n=1 Tax=Mesorhizobium sp. 8 TaxID=2584466 RepID=UPI00111D456D|nr:hypothetical protein [Mesorhizobium sp. 8]QDB99736.1 hypothetical protein FGU64_04555 [Mesorhizobium sp. 8]
MTRTERELAGLDAAIAAAKDAAEQATAEQHAAEARIAKLLAKRRDADARDAQAVADDAAGRAVLETKRLDALKAERSQAEAEAVAIAARWPEVETLLAKREQAAELADKAIAALGKYYAALASLDAEVNALVPNAANVTDNGRPYDPQAGVLYSMIAAGMPWAHKEGFAAVGKTAGRLLSDRVASSGNLIRQLR